MTPENQLQEKLWKAIKSDRTMMLSIDGVESGYARPMTAQLEHAGSPIWFFTSADNGLVSALESGNDCLATFSSQGHDLFATLHGKLSVDSDRATIDRLWNGFIAAWFEGGKEDPNLRLLRLDAARVEIWLNENNFLASMKMLLGMNPKADYADKSATIILG